MAPSSSSTEPPFWMIFSAALFSARTMAPRRSPRLEEAQGAFIDAPALTVPLPLLPLLPLPLPKPGGTEWRWCSFSPPCLGAQRFPPEMEGEAPAPCSGRVLGGSCGELLELCHGEPCVEDESRPYLISPPRSPALPLELLATSVNVMSLSSSELSEKKLGRAKVGKLEKFWFWAPTGGDVLWAPIGGDMGGFEVFTGTAGGVATAFGGSTERACCLIREGVACASCFLSSQAFLCCWLR
mmetsp:Transcript_15061/g.29978  ORF Transcript_15061/g.29978 Transcript_15061/m.29978 type:complete len:240 (-) Transcript_15061:4-723(-)